jgi:hypothetical protein
MLGTEQRLGQVKSDIEKRLRSFRNLGYFATIGLIIGLLAITLPILYAEWGKSREVEAQHGAEIKDLRDRLQEQKNSLEAIVAGQSAASLAPPAKSTAQSKTK